MIRLGLMVLLMNAAGVALAVLGYLCLRDGHEWFAVAFMVMAFFTISVPKASISASGSGESKDENNKKED